MPGALPVPRRRLPRHGESLSLGLRRGRRQVWPREPALRPAPPPLPQPAGARLRPLVLLNRPPLQLPSQPQAPPTLYHVQPPPPPKIHSARKLAWTLPASASPTRFCGLHGPWVPSHLVTCHRVSAPTAGLAVLQRTGLLVLARGPRPACTARPPDSGWRPQALWSLAPLSLRCVPRGAGVHSRGTPGTAVSVPKGSTSSAPSAHVRPASREEPRALTRLPGASAWARGALPGPSVVRVGPRHGSSSS